MSNLDELNSNVDSAEQEVAAAAEKRNAAVDARDTARVEAMDPALVEEARSLEINPRNFEDDDHLREAIELRKNETQGEEQ